MILVTGMHRSGTSLVAMTMEALGVPFGDHAAFYAADQWNARGYFERRDVMDVNSRMIAGFGRTSSRLGALVGQVVYLSEPELDKILARGPSYADVMVSIRDQTEDGAIKDPRLCLTWGAWAEVVDLDSVVVCIRHPFDVADSLRRRQHIPTKLGLRFWRYHMRALRSKLPDKVVIVDLDSLLASPRAELDMLVAALGLDIDTDDAVRRFHTTYSPGMAKKSPEKRPTLDPATADLWKWVAGLRPIPIVERTV
jgi:hypothetical protein